MTENNDVNGNSSNNIQESASKNIMQLMNSGILGIVLGLIFIFLIVISLNYFRIIDVSQYFHSPTVSNKVPQLFSPYVKKSLPAMESCAIKTRSYPLVFDVVDEDNVIIGEYRGYLKSITVTDTNAIITLVSKDGSQVYSFTVDKRLGISNSVHGQFISLGDLKQGDIIGIGFNCWKKNNKFTIMNVGVQNAL